MLPYYNPYYSYYYSDRGMWAMIGVFITYVWGITLPTLAATVRRLYDIGKPGATIFIGLLPFIWGIDNYLFYALILRKSQMNMDLLQNIPKF